MAYKIEWRAGTASQWATANPTLALAEKGVETDTGQFKIGTGSTPWNSLAYQGTTGPTQTLPFRSFGDGSDGNVTISSGTTSLSRDMYYNNLILNGTGILNTNGYKVFVKGYLDITAAQAGAIQWNGLAGGNGSGSTGGSAASTQSGGTVGPIAVGGAGGTGNTAGGGNGTAAPNTGTANGGSGGGGGSSGGSGGAGRSPTINNPFSRFEASFIFGAVLLSGGAGGAGGGGGGGDGVNAGGGAGAGGSGGGLVALYINSILKSSSTPSGVIQANGGVGGTGSNATSGVTQGGGGGGGGSGGWVYIAYNYLFGPTVSGLVQVNGGNGGAGGNGFGGGAGGNGGNSGTGGRINFFNVPTGASTNLVGGVNSTIYSPELIGTAPATETPTIGGNGGFNGTLTASL